MGNYRTIKTVRRFVSFIVDTTKNWENMRIPRDWVTSYSSNTQQGVRFFQGGRHTKRSVGTFDLFVKTEIITVITDWPITEVKLL